MDRWEPALRKNKSAFSVLGWGRANCDGPYVFTPPQERRGRIRMSGILHQAHSRPSWGQLSCTGMSCWGCVPSRANRDASLLQRIALKHGPCRAFQGEFHSLPAKAMVLVFEISWVAGQGREDCVSGGREEEKQASQEHQSVQEHHRDESHGDDQHTWVFILWPHCQQESLEFIKILRLSQVK